MDASYASDEIVRTFVSFDSRVRLITADLYAEIHISENIIRKIESR